MASFPAKTGWDRPKKGENENYRSNQFQPNPLQRIPKKQQKNKKTPFSLLFKPKQVGKGRERQKIKIIVHISSYPALYGEFHRKQLEI